MLPTVLFKGHTGPRCLSGEGLPLQDLWFPLQGTMATIWQAAFTGLQHLQMGRTTRVSNHFTDT